MLKATRANDRNLMLSEVLSILKGVDDIWLLGSMDYPGPREVGVDFTHTNGLAVTISFDGDSQLDREGTFCMAWHMTGDGERRTISDAFGLAMGSEVNQFHHRKCTAFGDSFEDLCVKLHKAVEMLNDGSAYRQEVTP